MRIKLIFTFSILLFACLLSVSAVAQEDGQNANELQEINSHPELNMSEDKTLLLDDAKPSNKVQQPRDTQTTNAKKPDAQQKSSNPSNGNKSDEDPLSFNFLYFIIQKFKYSDIVDD